MTNAFSFSIFRVLSILIPSHSYPFKEFVQHSHIFRDNINSSYKASTAARTTRWSLWWGTLSTRVVSGCTTFKGLALRNQYELWRYKGMASGVWNFCQVTWEIRSVQVLTGQNDHARGVLPRKVLHQDPQQDQCWKYAMCKPLSRIKNFHSDISLDKSLEITSKCRCRGQRKIAPIFTFYRNQSMPR